MLSNFTKIFSLLTFQERKTVYYLLIAIFVMGVFETAGIASILPLMTALSKPEVITTNHYFTYLYEIIGARNQNHFLLLLGLGALIVLILSNAFSAFTTWRLLRFIYMREHSISKRLFERYLGSPYVFFLNRNTTDLTKNVITEVHRVIIGVLTPALQIITRLIISCCILLFLIAMDPSLAFIVFLVCGGSYAVVFKLARRRLAREGKKSTEAQRLRYKMVSEGFGGIKELKLLNRESEFIHRFSKHSQSFACSESNAQSLTLLPKYGLETIVFGGILLIMLYFIAVKNSIDATLPLLALYAFAGYRLMPAFQQIFNGITLMRYHEAGLDTIFQDYQRLEKNFSDSESATVEEGNQVLRFQEELQLHDIVFTYPHADAPTINNLALTIKANTTVGFVGATGSGKTTTIDILLGLLPLSKGQLIVDDVVIDQKNLKYWQKNIGYVPQHIYLADDSVVRNIAFGVPAVDIDFHAVERAARIANLHTFVVNELSDGYNTIIGERGVRLSGGQRQRIGIARAMYHDPNVLILDEATSALDGITEHAIIEAIRNLSHKKTIIIIAHRLTTVKVCDRIFFLEKGRVKDFGTYSELVEISSEFNKMAYSG